MSELGTSLNAHYKNLQVLRASSAESLALLIASIRMPVRVHQFLKDGEDFIAYVTTSRGKVKIRRKD